MPYRFWRSRWWHVPAQRRSIVFAYLFIALASAIGWQAVDNLNDQRSADIEQRLDDIDRLTALSCEAAADGRNGLRALVFDLIAASPPETKARITAILDARLPVRNCAAEGFDEPSTESEGP